MQIGTKQFNRTKTTKNAIRYDVDGDVHPWIPYQKTFYLSLAEWEKWCHNNGHDPDDLPDYLSLDFHAIDIQPATGGKEPHEASKSLD